MSESLADIFAQEEARRIAEANSPEALAREAIADAAREARWGAPCPGGCGHAKRDCECPDEEPVEEEEGDNDEDD